MPKFYKQQWGEDPWMWISILCLLSLLRRNQWTERILPFTGASRTWSGGAESTASSWNHLLSTSEESICTKYIQFHFKGKCICRDFHVCTYHQSEVISQSLSILREHGKSICRDFHVCTYHQSEVISQSLSILREHGNRYHTPHNRMPFADVQAMLQFLENLATTHATLLSGHLPQHKIRLSSCSRTGKKICIPSVCQGMFLWQ